MLKGKPRNVAEGGGPDGQSYRDNPRVNAKIDAWIKANPKHWAYIESLPPDRMARALALNEVQKHERTQKFDSGIMRKLNENPEAKQAYETLVKHLPEDCAFRRIRTAIPIHIGQVFRSFVGHFSERSDAVGRFIRGGSISVKA